MKELLLRSWWMLALRGAIAIVFGLLAIMWPQLTLLLLVTLFGTYALLSGMVSVAGAVKNREHDEDWWLLLLLGLVSIGAGIVAFVHPALTALVLVLVIGMNALLTGVLDVAVAIRLRKHMQGEWFLILNGIVSIVFGTLVFIFPGAGALALLWMISFYALLTGLLLLTLAFRMRMHAATKTQGPERRTAMDRRTSIGHS